ncbi:MAG: phospho-sugar mutase, partial [Alphaproteobacteria bacterium]|nr:phospho-sugar mutase [Alphaproteobacteria bacterium]
MKYQEIYENWLNDPLIEEADRKELRSIKNNPKEIEDRFYQDLKFGTAGLRGIIGVGTNRINKYNIMKVTQGLADFINSHGKKAAEKGVAIAYDSRHFSPEFSETAASVLAGNGIKVYLFESLRPTPELSFAIRHYGAISGIVVTASHNPKEYNGYKVYWEDGAQITDEVSIPLTEQIQKITSLKKIKKMPLSGAIFKGLVQMLGKETDDIYLDMVKSVSLRTDIDSNICIVYTPLNGTGKTPIRRIMKELNYYNFHIVSEQADPDGDFTTVGYPNPEDPKAFAYAIELGKKIKADILIATDPDCDRLAAMVKDKSGKYHTLNGNQTGALLINYILSTLEFQRRLPGNGAIVKSIVTGDMGKAIADKFKIKTFEVLTGFKYICGKIREFEEKKKYTYLFGYEESIGYNAADFVRDKDGVMAAMLIAEMAAYYKRKGMTLLEVLEDLYQEYGYYREKLISMEKSGIKGQQIIANMMTGYRKKYPGQL